MVYYMFEPEWVLTAPIERVFELFEHPEEFSNWWPSVKNSRLIESVETMTHVRFNWYVSTEKSSMNFVVGFAKPLLVWAHHSVMREGCAAMADLLGARLVSTNTSLVEQPTPVPTAG